MNTQQLAIAYCRVSTTRQSVNGHSLKGQEKKLKELAISQGYRVEVVLETCSGRKAQRPKLNAALERLNNGEAQALFALDLDRLARSTRHALEIAETATKKKWRLVISTMNLDTNTSVGKMLLGQLAIFAEFESSLTSDRVKRQHEQRRLRGIVWGVDEGFRGSLSPATRQLIAELTNAGQSLNKIVLELTRLDHKTPRGGQWHKTSVRQIINSPQTKILLEV